MMMAALLENPRVFSLTQRLNPMTVRMYRRMILEHVVPAATASVLDIGCGVGAHYPLFPGRRYVGIDVNPSYVAAAIRRHHAHFEVMDGSRLAFPAGSFDTAFTVATCHHIDDAGIERMVGEVLRVVAPHGGFHIIDPIVPISPRAALKKALFSHDRGRYRRSIEQLTDLLARSGRLAHVAVRRGMLHDVCYVRVTS